jgi:two-component system sensor histidine kinase PhoQ
MNALIDNERARLSRYRNTLDDLAHSLKTPLAAMQTLLAEAKSRDEQRPALQRELLRMNKLVSYQLQRARAGGSTGFGSQPVDLEESISELCLTLDKVYLEKQVQCELDIAVGTRFIGDAGDLSEMLGNLIENAYKYCQHKVHVSACNEGSELRVTIDDDGPGISAKDFELLLERGTRADESVAGQGIGLAVVNETARLYNGALSVAASPMGGARIELRLGRAGERRQYAR